MTDVTVFTGSLVDSNVDELMTENKELKETLEEKIKEADKYLDKYCSLLISHEELEKTKEILEIQVARLSSRQNKQDLQSSPLLDSSVAGPSPSTSVSERKSTSGLNKTLGKRQRSSGIGENGNGTAPSTPETFSKKSRKSVSNSAHPAEDEEETEFEPEGLPEVVKKGGQRLYRAYRVTAMSIQLMCRPGRSSHVALRSVLCVNMRSLRFHIELAPGKIEIFTF